MPLYQLLLTISILGFRVEGNSGYFCDEVLNLRNFKTAPPWNLQDCDLHWFQQKDVTACFEEVESTSTVFQMARNNKSRSYLHDIVFYGDSRPRQQFVTLNHKFLPRYDLFWNPEAKNQRFKFGHDASVESSLLNARVSYKYRIVFNSDVERDLRLWTTYPYTETPTLVIMGIAIHAIYMSGLKDYQVKLTGMEPLIRRLASVTDVIWWVQDPVIDSNNEWSSPFMNMFSTPLVAKYNRAAREILKDSGVRFWDSSQPFGRDYSRGCAVWRRVDPYRYRHCFDGNHMGFVNNEKIINLLLNFYCNGFLAQKRRQYPFLNFTNNTCCFN